MGKVYSRFLTKKAQNPTRWHICGLYKGVSPPRVIGQVNYNKEIIFGMNKDHLTNNLKTPCSTTRRFVKVIACAAITSNELHEVRRVRDEESLGTYLKWMMRPTAIGNSAKKGIPDVILSSPVWNWNKGKFQFVYDHFQRSRSLFISVPFKLHPS